MFHFYESQRCIVGENYIKTRERWEQEHPWQSIMYMLTKLAINCKLFLNHQRQTEVQLGEGGKDMVEKVLAPAGFGGELPIA